MAAKIDSYIVGCKLPNGLSFNHVEHKIILNGVNSSALINGFGITRDVPAEAWETFAKNHAESKFIKNGIVFAVTDDKSVADASLERSKQKTGLEQASTKAAGVEPLKEE